MNSTQGQFQTTYPKVLEPRLKLLMSENQWDLVDYGRKTMAQALEETYQGFLAMDGKMELTPAEEALALQQTQSVS